MKLHFATGLLCFATFAAPTCLAEPYRPPRLEDGEQATAIEERILGMRRSQATGAAAEAFDEQRSVEPIDGEWHSSVIVHPTDGRIPGNAAFRKEAAEIYTRTLSRGDGPEERPPAERCLTSPASTPPMLSVPTLNLHQIVQTPGTVLIQSEWNRDARVVRIDQPHNPPALTSWLGDSVGRWDGDALVVETRYFTATSSLRSTAGIFVLVSPATVVTERFTRTADDELTYEFSVTDPTWYMTTWHGRNRLRRSSEPIYEFACHEGNHAIRFVLQGMRAREAGSGSD